MILHQILALTGKDLKLFFKDVKAMAVIFLQPFLFIVIMSYALAGVYGSGGKAIKILAVNEDEGKQAGRVIESLSGLKGFSIETKREGIPLTRAMAEELVAKGASGIAVVFPRDFSSVLEYLPQGEKRPTTKVLLVADPLTSDAVTDPVMGTLQGLIERTASVAMMPKGIDYFFKQFHLKEAGVDIEEFKKRAEESVSRGQQEGDTKAVSIEKVMPPSVKVKKFPDSFQQNVPGYTIYGVFWIASLLAASVLREKREGTFRRLMAAPLSGAVILIGKLLPYYLVNLIQIAIMMGASALIFNMSLGSSFAGLAVVSLVLAAAATGLGILISAVTRTEAQANGLAVLVLLMLSSLGGCFVPRFIMPEALKTVGLITPHAWALDAYQDLIVRGSGLVDVIPKVGALAGFALLFFAIGVWRFRFE